MSEPEETEETPGLAEAERTIAAEGRTKAKEAAETTEKIGPTVAERTIAAEETTKAAEMIGDTGIRETVESFLRLAGRQS